MHVSSLDFHARSGKTDCRRMLQWIQVFSVGNESVYSPGHEVNANYKLCVRF